jgi:hypothetical protein
MPLSNLHGVTTHKTSLSVIRTETASDPTTATVHSASSPDNQNSSLCGLSGMLVLVKFSLTQNKNCEDNNNQSYEDKSTAQQSKRNRHQIYIRQTTLSNIIDKRVITSTTHDLKRAIKSMDASRQVYKLLWSCSIESKFTEGYKKTTV